MKQNWILVGAISAMMVTAPLGAFAQTPPADTPAPSPAPAPPMNTAAPMAPMNAGTPMAGGTPDFKLLADPAFDYPAIKGAMAKGFSESQVASVLYIAKQTGMSFRDVVDVALEGKTFAAIAYDHNLRLSDVLDPDLEKQQIASFLAAYESTGMMAFKNMPAKE